MYKATLKIVTSFEDKTFDREITASEAEALEAQIEDIIRVVMSNGYLHDIHEYGSKWTYIPPHTVVAIEIEYIPSFDTEEEPLEEETTSEEEND